MHFTPRQPDQVDMLFHNLFHFGFVYWTTVYVRNLLNKELVKLIFMFGLSFGSCFAFYKSRRMRDIWRRRSRRQCKPICIKLYLSEGRGSGYCIPCIQIPYVKKFPYVIKFIVPDLNFMVKCCLEFFVKFNYHLL